jgi:hypothetical protein
MAGISVRNSEMIEINIHKEVFVRKLTRDGSDAITLCGLDKKVMASQPLQSALPFVWIVCPFELFAVSFSEI